MVLINLSLVDYEYMVLNVMNMCMICVSRFVRWRTMRSTRDQPGMLAHVHMFLGIHWICYDYDMAGGV